MAVPPPRPFNYTPTRRTQPYRDNGQRQQSSALQSMLGGQPFHMANPMDVQRQFFSQAPPPVEGGLAWHLARLNRLYSSSRGM